MKSFFHRHQAPVAPHMSLKAGLGGLLAIGMVAWLSQASGMPWLMAPFGATCVLVFGLPASPLSQPANVIGGHLLSTALGLLAATLLPDAWWAGAVAVGLAIALMQMLRVTHPPAGADPLVVLAGHAGWDFLLFPVLVGSILLAVGGAMVHRLPPRIQYPLKPN